MLIENEDYWIKNDIIIFKPSFDKELDNFYEILSNHKYIIFSEYDDVSTSYDIFQAELENIPYADIIKNKKKFLLNLINQLFYTITY